MADHKDGSGFFVIIVTVFLVGCIVGFLLGVNVGSWGGIEDTRRAAIKAGAAEWVADTDGRPEFQWITPSDNMD